MTFKVREKNYPVTKVTLYLPKLVKLHKCHQPQNCPETVPLTFLLELFCEVV